MAGAGVPVPSADDGAIVVAPQACFEVESHENGVVIHLQRGGPRRSWSLRGLEEMRGPFSSVVLIRGCTEGWARAFLMTTDES